MKRSVQFIVASVVLVLLTIAVGEAQVTTGTGAIGFTLDKYARLRVGEFPYATATRHMNRINPIVALNKNAVFDYNENANATSYLPQMIAGSGADSAARVVTDNKYAPIQPPNVRVQMTVYLWKNAKYLIYRYRVYNDSTVTAPLYISSFASPSPANTYGGETVVYNTAKSTYYFYRTGTPVYVSQKLLNKNLFSMRIMDWAVYSPADPSSDAATDSARYVMSAYTKFDTLLTAGPDGSAVQMNAGLYNLAPKDSADVYFAIGLGASAAEAIAVMDSAQTKYSKLVTSVEKTTAIVPTQFALEQNYPNPFNPSTQIRFMLTARSNVTLTVYDALGRNIRTLVNQQLDAGEYVSTFDATGLSSGVYFYVLKAGSLIESKRMVLIR
ncbi:MAG: T9SS type A sorting domain-containing protein [Ignavibacteriales bacterium]|nr:T9SS type A sorting domain-containing protein [Ignavibacteriales bacterium]